MSERRYELLDPLGEGGFGKVYRARLVGLGGFTKVVAIKVLNDEAAAMQEFAKRLRDEARLLGMLRHRAIVHVDDLTRIEGRWAIVMEYIEGADLGALIERVVIPPRCICEIARETASALDVAHKALDPGSGRPLQFIHRDIKPSNIRLTTTGDVKVLDFGISKAVFGEREAMTRSLAFGSPGYLAPERLSFEDSPAGDVYALALVICDALLGTPRGQINPDRTRHDRAVGRLLARLAELESGPSRPFIALVGEMLSFEPEERPKALMVARRLQDLAPREAGPWLADWARELFSAPVPLELAEEDLAPAEEDVAELEPPVPRPDEPPPPAPPARDTGPVPPETRWYAVQTPDRLPQATPRSAVEAPRPGRRLGPGSWLVVAALFMSLVGASLWRWAVGSASPAPAPSAPAGASDEAGAAADLPPQAPQEPAPATTEQALPASEAVDAAPSAEARPVGAPARESVARASRAATTRSVAVEAPSAPTAAAAPPPEPETSQDVEPPPEPDEDPPAPPPPPPARIIITSTAGVSNVRLVDSGGARHGSGEVPPGTYDVEASFGSGAVIHLQSFVTVKAGQTFTLHCDARAENCY